VCNRIADITHADRRRGSPLRKSSTIFWLSKLYQEEVRSFSLKVVLSVQKDVQESGSVQVVLFNLGGNEVARFSYETSPPPESVRSEVAAKMDVNAGQVELLLPDGSRWESDAIPT